jgi:hypothetical protein
MIQDYKEAFKALARALNALIKRVAYAIFYYTCTTI